MNERQVRGTFLARESKNNERAAGPGDLEALPYTILKQSDGLFFCKLVIKDKRS